MIATTTCNALRVCSTILGFVILFTEGAQAIDFSDVLRTYREDYVGEVAFPATPEVNTHPAGDEYFFVSGAFDFPDFTGAELRIPMSGAGFAGGEVPLASFGAVPLGVRGEFAASALESDSEILAAVTVGGRSYTGPIGLIGGTPPAAHLTCGAGVSISDAAIEFRVVSSLHGTVLDEQSFPIPVGDSAAIRSGARFTIDFRLLNVGGGDFEASVSVEGGTTTTVELGQLVCPTDLYWIDRAGHSVEGMGFGAIDFEGLEIHKSVTASFTVDTAVDEVDANVGDGECATFAGACTLRAAVMESNALVGAGEIFVPAGNYTFIDDHQEDFAEAGDLDVRSDLLIHGAGAGDTIIDARSRDRVFEIHSALELSRVLLEGVTIRKGGMLASTTPLPFAGGGVFNWGRLTLRDCVIEGNSATTGAGVMNQAVLEVDGCVVRENHAVDFGETPGRVGGIASGVLTIPSTSSSTLEIRNSAVIDNQPSGIDTTNSDFARFENTTVSGNGGLEVTLYNTDAVLQHVTIDGGSAPAFSAGSYLGDDVLEVSNSVLVGAPACLVSSTPTIDVFAGHNAENGASCGFTGPGDLEGINSALMPLAYTQGSAALVPAPGSPLVDAASLEFCLLDDQLGSNRPVDGDGDGVAACDIGAIEVPEPGFAGMLSAGILLLSCAGRPGRFAASVRGR